MGSFLHGLQHVLKTGFDLSDLGQRYEQQKERRRNTEDLRNNADAEFASMIQDKGAKFIHSGTVDDDGILRPADKTRTIRHKTAQGETLEFELPTEAQQIRTKSDRLMQQFDAEAPIRGKQQSESIDLAGRQEGARQNARSSAEAADREANGIEVPDALDQIFPGISNGGMSRPRAAAPMAAGSDPGSFSQPTKRKMKPDEIDNLIRSAGSFENVQSQIKARNAKPTKTIKDTKITEDKNGNQVNVITYDDGTVSETPLKAKGKGKTEGGITEYQQAELKNRAEDKKAAAIKTQQDQLDNIQSQQDTLVGDTEKASREYESLQTDLAAGNFESVAQKAAVLKKSGELRGVIAANHVKHAALEEKKKATDVIRRNLMGQSSAGAASASQTAQGAGAAASAARPILAQDAKGNQVRLVDGQWVPVTKTTQ